MLRSLFSFLAVLSVSFETPVDAAGHLWPLRHSARWHSGQSDTGHGTVFRAHHVPCLALMTPINTRTI